MCNLNLRSAHDQCELRVMAVAFGTFVDLGKGHNKSTFVCTPVESAVASQMLTFPTGSRLCTFQQSGMRTVVSLSENSVAEGSGGGNVCGATVLNAFND